MLAFLNNLLKIKITQVGMPVRAYVDATLCLSEVCGALIISIIKGCRFKKKCKKVIMKKKKEKKEHGRCY